MAARGREQLLRLACGGDAKWRVSAERAVFFGLRRGTRSSQLYRARASGESLRKKAAVVIDAPACFSMMRSAAGPATTSAARGIGGASADGRI